MPILTDTAFFKQLKSGVVHNCYLLYGEERFFVLKAQKMLQEVLSPSDTPSFNLVTFDGEKLNLSDLEDALNSFPLMFSQEQKKIVIVKDCDFEKLLKADFEEMLSLIEGVCDDTVLIFYQPNITVDLKKSTKYKKLIDLISKDGSRDGIVCYFPIKDKLTLQRALCERAKKASLLLTMETASSLIDRSSSSYSLLDNEMDKLIAFANGQNKNEITLEDINTCSIENIEGSSFDLAKNILNNRFDKAFSLLDDLFFLRQEPVMILSALSLAFLDIYRAKLCNSPEQIQTDFSYAKNRIWAIKNAMRDCKNIKLSHIHVCIAALYNADIALKSSKLDNRLIIEKAFFQMQEV